MALYKVCDNISGLPGSELKNYMWAGSGLGKVKRNCQEWERSGADNTAREAGKQKNKGVCGYSICQTGHSIKMEFMEVYEGGATWRARTI